MTDLYEYEKKKTNYYAYFLIIVSSLCKNHYERENN